MKNKYRLRKKYFIIRKRKYFKIGSNFFNPLVKLVKENYKEKSINISSYYPSSFEVNTLKLFEIKIIKDLKVLLPVLSEKNIMHFYKWKQLDALQINKFGMLEPVALSTHIIPDIMLVPLLAYDNQHNRLGYGGGFYDRYLNRYLKTKKHIITIGVAFSFQRHHKIPVSKNDVKLNYILTEKGIF